MGVRYSGRINLVSGLLKSFTPPPVFNWPSAIEQDEFRGVSPEASAVNDNFGQSVSLSSNGNTAIIGAHLRDDISTADGAAYVWVRSSGVWSQQAYLEASDGVGNERFGESVAISSDGNTAIVGAREQGLSDRGAAYIYTRSGSTWTEEQKIEAPVPTSNEWFGQSVSISNDGNTVAVGAPGRDSQGLDGAVYIFTRTAGTWTLQDTLVASDAAANDKFGDSVALSGNGDNVIIGATRETTAGSPQAGAAYIFTRSGSTWTEEQKIIGSTVNAQDQFGYAVAMSDDGNSAVVTAPIAGSGRAFFFTRTAGSWSEEEILSGSGQFGRSVGMSGDGNTLVVGAPFEDTTQPDSGALYVYTHDGSTWGSPLFIKAGSPANGDRLGWSASMSNDGGTVMAGTPTAIGGRGSVNVFISG